MLIDNLPLSIYFEFLALIAVIVSLLLQRKQPFYIRLFPFFLIVTLTIEITSVYLAMNGQETVLIYNYFGAFEFSFYLFVFRSILYRKEYKKILEWTFILYIIFAIVNINLLQDGNFISYGYSIGSIVMVASAVLYFYDLFYTAAPVELIREPAFWISSAVLFYYCCSFPLMASTNFLTTSAYVDQFSRIIILLNVFLYTLFAIAFLCQIKLKNSTSLS